MKSFVLGLMVALLASHAGAREYCAVPELGTLSAIVRIGGADTEGSGVVIGHNLIVTAAHVIEGLSYLTVRVNGESRQADVLSLYPDRDLALLVADTGGQMPIPLRYADLNLYDPVWAVGFPLGGNQLASKGIFEGMVDGSLQTTASVNHGQSGGGLISCENGEYVLAGIITAFGAIDMGDHYVRLDDYSISVPVDFIASMMYASIE